MKCSNCELIIPKGEQLSSDEPMAHVNLERCLELLVFVKDQLLISLKDAEKRAAKERDARVEVWHQAEKEKYDLKAELVTTKKDQKIYLTKIESLKSQLADAGDLAKKHDEHFLSRIDALRARIAEVENELSRACKRAGQWYDRNGQLADQLEGAEKERDELRNRHDPVMFLRCLACNKAANVSDLKVDESGLSYLSCRNCTKETHVPHEKILAGLAEAWGQANKRNNEAIQLAKQLVLAEGHILGLEKKLHPLVEVKIDHDKSVMDQAVEYFQNNPDPGLPSNEEGGAVDG